MNATDTFDRRSGIRTTTAALGIAAALWLLGRGALSTPPVDSWTGFQRWLGDRSTAEAAIASLRATAVVAACYLAAVSTLTIVASAASADQLYRLARSLVPRSIRPLIGLAVGAGVATAATSMTVPRDATPNRVATVTLEAPSDATATMYIVTEPSPPTSTTATLTTLPLSPPVPPVPPVAAGPTPPSTTLPTPAATAPRIWTIAPGEHLWAVASETLTDSWHRAPTDAQVTRYWRDLIEANRTRLIDATNPDYVLAGQTFVLPEVPAAPTTK